MVTGATFPFPARIKRGNFEREMTAAKPAAATASADGEELGPALGTEFVAAELAAAVELLDQRPLECPDCSVGVTVRSPQRLADDPVHDAERLEVRRRDLHRLGRFGRLVG